MFQNNIFMNLAGVPSDDYAFPSGNIIVSHLKDVGFLNPVGNDYHLAAGSKYRGKSCDICRAPARFIKILF